MKYRVEITPSAEADIDEAYRYIRNDSPENAAKWRQGLYQIAENLTLFPEGCSYALENEALDFEVRQKLYGNYRVLLTIDDDRVIVLNVRHAARLPMKAGDIIRPGGTSDEQ